MEDMNIKQANISISIQEESKKIIANQNKSKDIIEEEKK